MKASTILALILALQAVLLYTNLSDIPRWEWDDGVNMEIAWNLANGRMQMYALTYPFVPHPPLFFAVLAVLLKTFGNKLIVLRFLTAAYALLTTVVVYHIGKKVSGTKLGLTGAFLYAIYPENIYWSRLGFANSQLMLLTALSLYFFLRGGKFRTLSYITISLALVTEFTAVALLFSVLGLLYLERDLRGMIKASALSLSVPAFAYTLIYFTPVKEALIYDVFYALSRFTPGIRVFALNVGLVLLIALFWGRVRKFFWGLFRKVRVIAVRDLKFTFGGYGEWLVRQDSFLVLAALNLVLAVRTLTPFSDDLLFRGHDSVFFDYFWVGLFGIFVLREKATLFFFLPLFILTLALGRTDHMILPLYPFFSLGLGVLLPCVYESILVLFSGWMTHSKALSIAFLLVFYPFAVLLAQDVLSFVYGVGLVRQDTAAVMDVVGFLDDNTEPSDVVLSNSHISRLIKAHGTELYQGFIAEGKSVSYFGRVPPTRFVYNSSYRKAKFVALHRDSLSAIVRDPPGGDDISREVYDISSWPVVYRRGELLVYSKPLEEDSAVEDNPKPEQ